MELIKKTKYLYETTISDVDYNYAEHYFKHDTAPFVANGLCTSVSNNGMLYRNYDWYYNNDVAFVTHIPELENSYFVHGKRYKSVGVADSVPNLNVSFVESGADSDYYKLIPFYFTDGVNEKKVGISMNVVPKEKGVNSKTVPAVEERYEVQESALPRFVLDNFETAREAVDYLQNYVSIYPSRALQSSAYDIHYLICDNIQSFVVELINNTIVVKEVGLSNPLKAVITNFHVIKNVQGETITLDANGKVYTPSTGLNPTSQGITAHGSGLERYNIIVENYSDLHDFRNLVLYNKAYLTETNPQWYTEFVGDYTAGNLTVDSSSDEFETIIMPTVREMYENRSRETAQTWHTSHTSVYNLSMGKLSVCDSSESGVAYNFSLTQPEPQPEPDEPIIDKPNKRAHAMRTTPRFVTPSDFENYTGKNLLEELGVSANESNKADIFLMNLEDEMLARIDNISFRLRCWDNLSDYQLESLQKAILVEADYIIRNSELFKDSGYDPDKGEIISVAKLKNIAICPTSMDFLTNCGLLNHVIMNRHRYTKLR